MSGSYTFPGMPNMSPWTNNPLYSPSSDEDMEESDRQNIRLLIDKYFESQYPEFEPELVTMVDGDHMKEYYLPALKVLVRVGNDFFSPGFGSLWKDGELRATCMKDNDTLYSISYQLAVLGVQEADIRAARHDAPADNCECGIYGSVNVEEILSYLMKDFSPKFHVSPRTYNDWRFGNLQSAYTYIEERDPYPNIPAGLVLCLIEPSPDAKVILCRKGWKASHTFISEIVGETISWDNAYQVLQLAWKRSIDLMPLYQSYRNRSER